MTYIIKGEKSNWEVVLGLEVHAQINAKSKLFSTAANNYGAAPNSQVALVDAGMPGALPVINKECVKQAILTGIGLNAEINLISIFDRKNYFYPDLPQGYQISQFTHPIVGNGYIFIDTEHGQKKIGITRLHLEQDAGKSLHVENTDYSLIDLNRSGCGLMEIVSEPDLRSPNEAAEYVKKLRSILRYVGSCDGNMEYIQKQDGDMVIQGEFSLKNLGYFIKCTNLCGTIEMLLENDLPLVVKYSVASLGEIKLCLAPLPSS